MGAAVSGGADSVAMLRLLLELRHELGIVLSVVHFNHNLRGAESDGDERFVAELSQCHELQLHCESADVARYGTEKHLSLETAARELRYAYFGRLLGVGCTIRIATGHTLDDQAETVLMRVARGAGTRGLAGITPIGGCGFSVLWRYRSSITRDSADRVGNLSHGHRAGLARGFQQSRLVLCPESGAAYDLAAAGRELKPGGARNLG